MAESVHKNSLDEDNRRFVPDEVFETVEEAQDTIEFLMSVYKMEDGSLVYPILLKDEMNVGYVQLVPIEEGYEVGYHIGKEYTKKGYASKYSQRARCKDAVTYRHRADILMKEICLQIQQMMVLSRL